MSTDHNFRRERRAEAASNRGPSVYQPNALPLGQTGHYCRSSNKTPSSQPFHVPCLAALRGRCQVWPWLSEFSNVVLRCFTLSRSLDSFHAVLLFSQTGRLVQPIVHGSSLFSVMGQDTCEYDNQFDIPS